MGFFGLAFAFMALALTIKETYGFWRVFVSLILALSVVSFFMEWEIVFALTVFIGMCCIPYLIRQGYDFFRR